MKESILFILLALFINGTIFAHKEPAKTLKEKEKEAKKRQNILKNKIVSYTLWKHEIKDNKPKMDEQQKFIKMNFDNRGNNVQTAVYKNTDTLSYTIVYSYDENNTITTNSEINPDASLIKRAIYSHNDKGLLESQINYDADNKVESRFTYIPDHKTNTLIFTKYKPLDSIEYQIFYKYDSSINEGNNTEIIKQETDGSLILRVENLFDAQNKRVKKKIIGFNNELLYYFEYFYFENTDDYAVIHKKMATGELISVTKYKLNDSGLVQSVTNTDNTGNILSYTSYDYEYAE